MHATKVRPCFSHLWKPTPTLLVLALAACGGGGGVAPGGGGSGGGGGGGGGTGDPPPGLAAPPFLSGLSAAAAGASSARVEWTLPGTGFEAALFRASQPSLVYAGSPVAESLSGDGTVVLGLAGDSDHYFGLGLRLSGASAWQPTGLILRARTADPVYVDAAASAQGADGASPASALPDLQAGLDLAAAQGGGNLWVRDGQYAGGPYTVSAGVHVLGGFGAGFVLAERDGTGTQTVLRGTAGQPIVVVEGGDPGVVLDGLKIRGGSIGVDASDTPLDLRSVDVAGCSDRGIRARNASIVDSFDLALAGCTSSANGADGLSIQGPFDVYVDGSRFDSNVQEGLDLDDLVALAGETATLRVSGSRFFGNGQEGLDADLAAPVSAAGPGGRFALAISASRFEQNGAGGLLIDFDFELQPAWFADVVVSDCLARANALSGIRCDVDAPGDVLVHRTLCTANAGDGLWVSSESDAGLVVVSTSVFSGNLGAGLRASLGNRAVVAGHCVFAGNLEGGIKSTTVESSLSSGVAFLQPNPWPGTRRQASVRVDDPLAGLFVAAPEGYHEVVAHSGGQCTLAPGDSVAPGARIELADDGVERSALQMSGNQVSVSPDPQGFRAPGLLSVFAPAASVDEDYRLPPGSPAEGAGLTPPGGASIDAGAWGSPTAGEPGAAHEAAGAPFRLAATEPALSAGLGASQTLDLRFSAALDPAALTPGLVRAVDDSQVELAIGLSLNGSVLSVSPPPGGWGSTPVTLELHAGIRALDGRPLCTSLILPLKVQ